MNEIQNIYAVITFEGDQEILCSYGTDVNVQIVSPNLVNMQEVCQFMGEQNTSRKFQIAAFQRLSDNYGSVELQ